LHAALFIIAGLRTCAKQYSRTLQGLLYAKNGRPRQLRYVTELGFDVYSKFYQLPVT